MKSNAWFSPCEKYRYGLTRVWDEQKLILPFCMLNPSTADAKLNDPTITRCMARADRMGFGGILVVNLFALRSTNPKALYEAEDPVGPENDTYIGHATKWGIIVCGWGKHGSLNQRGDQVVHMIKEARAQALALRINKDGSPAHPLYLKYDMRPVDLVTGEPFVDKEQNVHRL